MKRSNTFCHICEKEKQEGMHVYTLFICKSCEQAMIHTEPHEERYRYYVEKLRQLNQSQLYS